MSTGGFGGILRESRMAKRITLRALGKQLQRGASFLSELENGIRPAPKDEGFLINLSEALGLEATILLRAAEEGREQQNPKRLRGLLRKDPELAACFLRVSRKVENDEQLARVLRKALCSVEEDIKHDKGSHSSCS